ncbi:metalloregulator ArsR/SmtB family transcription factor [Paenibacillus sp.]|jgi:DNA-binding transcriptional ArsR family regulator|uniref:ArsR/SmtB family transcription factor n=1 Tax=Paenibacillus sp. TaxID=58172 RepID=UPI00282477BE|nr:metalloregulator ArsR/SmtB family transcription factor [Paenibacillus sp.]MDR0267785.1 metalloregulator ArsR/SmtB family transcription factor [Paenibacillus sp.]
MDKQFKAYNQTAEILKALAHPVRLCIVKGIIQGGGCNVSHMQECLELPQSTVSQHLQKLRSSGIVETERNGLEIIYSIKDKKIEQLIQLLFGEE